MILSNFLMCHPRSLVSFYCLLADSKASRSSVFYHIHCYKNLQLLFLLKTRLHSLGKTYFQINRHILLIESLLSFSILLIFVGEIIYIIVKFFHWKISLWPSGTNTSINRRNFSIYTVEQGTPRNNFKGLYVN